MNEQKRKELKKYIESNKILALYKQYKVDTEKDRWAEGVDHHPKSQELMKHISELDFAFFDDSFGWKMGGDGDNGESLMFIMDLFFELQDKMKADET
jgi:hypothetical protein